MTSTDSPQRARPNWSKRIAIAVGCMAIVGLIVGLAIFGATKVATKCEDIDEPSVRSPDGRWVAESTIRACPAGPLSVTNYDVIVALATTQTQASAKVDRVQIFENFGSSEPPTITWASPNVLELEINSEGIVRVSKHEFANVTINYVIPNSLWDDLGKIEADRLQHDRESEELYQAGKSSRDDLRIELQLHRAGAEEWTNFRQWVLENASHERDPANNPPFPK